MYGNLPSQSQLADWEFTVSQHSAVPQGVLVKFLLFRYLDFHTSANSKLCIRMQIQTKEGF